MWVVISISPANPPGRPHFAWIFSTPVAKTKYASEPHPRGECVRRALSLLAQGLDELQVRDQIQPNVCSAGASLARKMGERTPTLRAVFEAIGLVPREAP